MICICTQFVSWADEFRQAAVTKEQYEHGVYVLYKSEKTEKHGILYVLRKLKQDGRITGLSR